jgi:hypothetical protein
MTSTAAPLDFATLLSREYRPARLAQIIPRDSLQKNLLRQEEETEDADDGISNSNNNKKKEDHKKHNQQLLNDLKHATDRTTPDAAPSAQEREEEAGRLVLQLVSKTPAYKRHLENKEDMLVDDSELQTYIQRLRPTPTLPVSSSLFHQVQLDNWEMKIEWDGYKEKIPTTDIKQEPVNAATLLQKRRNPFLEMLEFDNLISWTGDKQDVARKAKSLPLILELGVAGQSIARHVLPSHRPMPCGKTDAYQNRLEADWASGEITSTELFSRGTLHADKDKMERLIAQRQEKRRQMAKDKTNRVTDAMGTLDVLDGGRGRTITSSLMGPGGTERTGRPSRNAVNVNHDTEYAEQLDMVINHTLVRDLSKVTLREYHRPKLPLTVVRTSLIWEFQIRYMPTSKKGPTPENTANSSSYQAMMMGTHPGAVSKAKLRTEADLSPTEGTLVLLEYTEERPPIQLTKGMASKIVTYFRGDKARCPVSAGGGERPTRRKRAGEQKDEEKSLVSQAAKVERPPRLVGPNRALNTTITDWVGKPPKKTREDRNKNELSVNILPEGVTEILHPKVHGPFIGEIDEGQSLTGLVSNLFVAPLFRHEPESTDFLMILGRNAGSSIPGRHESLGVVLRELPTSVFSVGQTEPRTRVYAPNTQGEKNFIGPFVSYQIAKVLARTEAREGHGLRFDEIQDRVLPNLGLPPNALRQRLKQVALYDKNTQIWTTKAIGYEDYPGVEALGKQIPPEGVAAYEVSSASVRRLSDLGIHQLFSGAHAVGSVGVTMVYLAGQLNTTKELARKVKKLGEVSRSNKSVQPAQVKFYEEAAIELDNLYKALRQKHEVAKFIYEELQLAPWHLTGEFIEVHKKAEGTGMMKLTGLGDPSGIGEGFSFLREVDSKPTKSVSTSQQTEQMKKITGTEDDLRKLTMKQMARILRSYGMAQKQIDTLKRWDRVHVIRDLSTKAASDGIGDGLERFARGEKMKLSEQKQMYRDRIQVIWKRQVAALSIDSSDGRASGGDGGAAAAEADEAAARPAQQKKETVGKDDSDSESEDDDFAAEMEEEMMDRPEANQLVAAQARDSGGIGADASLGQLRNAAQDQDLSKDARELAALKRQREEERAAREGLSSLTPSKKPTNIAQHSLVNRKIVRKKITKTHPDGRQTTTFKFVVHPEEVGKIMARLNQQKAHEKPRRKEIPEYQADDKQIGHAFFEDEDDFEYSSRGRGSMLKRRGAGRRARAGATAKAPPRKKEFQFGKLKNKVSKEQRIKKRKRDEEEAELYESVSKRKGTSNRKERGSIRARRPHVILADRLEAIRSTIESRPSSGPFVKPVNRRQLPRYYEVISHPIDLATIRDKIQKYVS